MKNKRTSYIRTEFRAKQNESEQKQIEGYFIVFDQPTELWPGFFERVSPSAVSDLTDVRALYNHDANLVLGSTLNNTLVLEKDEHGVKGVITINEADSEAVNVYERIKRGDIAGCSFGFELVRESYEENDDRSVTATIEELKLYEVSPCVFPAYPQTAVSARKRDFEEHEARLLKAKRETLQKRFAEVLNAETSDQSE